MIKYQIWQRKNGELYAVEMKAVGSIPRWEIIGAYGPITEKELENVLLISDFPFSRELVPWIEENRDEFEIYE